MKEYVRNRVLASMISPHAYFVPKAELLDGGILRVTGKEDRIESTFEQLLSVAMSIANQQGVKVTCEIHYPKPAKKKARARKR